VTQQVDLASLYRLRQADLLPAARFLKAAGLLRDDAFWTRQGHRALLGLGLVHILAGIICFFAFNWADMPSFAKFAVIATGIVLCALSSWRVGIHRPAGEALLIGASVLAGVLLAVIGQVYQTGADAFQLFAAWGLVILPWVLVSRSAAHWAMWGLIYYLAWSFYLIQAWVFIHPSELTEITVIGLAAIVPIAGLVMREAATSAGIDWLNRSWTRVLPLLIAAGHLLLMGFEILLKDTGIPYLTVPTIGLLLAMAFYGWARPSFPAFALAAASIAGLIAATGWRIFALGLEDALILGANPEVLLFVLMTLWCLGVAFGLQRLLQWARPHVEGHHP